MERALVPISLGEGSPRQDLRFPHPCGSYNISPGQCLVYNFSWSKTFLGCLVWLYMLQIPPFPLGLTESKKIRSKPQNKFLTLLL